MAKKKNKARKRFKAQSKPTERWITQYEPHDATGEMWHALMRAVATVKGEDRD